MSQAQVDWQASGSAARRLDDAVSAGVAVRLPTGGYRSMHPADSSLADVLGAMGIAADAPLLLMHDGKRVPPAELTTRHIGQSDRLVLMPAIRAG